MYYNEASCGRFVSRAILIDLEFGFMFRVHVHEKNPIRVGLAPKHWTWLLESGVIPIVHVSMIKLHQRS